MRAAVDLDAEQSAGAATPTATRRGSFGAGSLSTMPRATWRR